MSFTEIPHPTGYGLEDNKRNSTILFDIFNGNNSHILNGTDDVKNIADIILEQTTRDIRTIDLRLPELSIESVKNLILEKTGIKEETHGYNTDTIYQKKPYIVVLGFEEFILQLPSKPDNAKTENQIFQILGLADKYCGGMLLASDGDNWDEVTQKLEEKDLYFLKKFINDFAMLSVVH